MAASVFEHIAPAIAAQAGNDDADDIARAITFRA
jgi:hypothetical protein